MSQDEKIRGIPTLPRPLHGLYFSAQWGRHSCLPALISHGRQECLPHCTYRSLFFLCVRVAGLLGRYYAHQTQKVLRREVQVCVEIPKPANWGKGNWEEMDGKWGGWRNRRRLVRSEEILRDRFQLHAILPAMSLQPCHVYDEAMLLFARWKIDAIPHGFQGQGDQMSSPSLVVALQLLDT